MQIGLLEDDIAIQEMLHLVLQEEGYTVTIYPTAQACLDILLAGKQEQEAVPIDLLIVDLRLSREMSGIEVIQHLRSAPHLLSLPIILTTAGSFKHIEDLSHLHVTFLEKPFDLDEIVKIIDDLIAGSSKSSYIDAVG